MDQQFFRFADHREKYLLFVNTCDEKRESAKRIALELGHITPTPPSINVFQVHSGEGTLQKMVLRDLHNRWPHVPILVVIKENSADMVRVAARNLADRFREHPELVLVITNLSYEQAAACDIDMVKNADDDVQYRTLALTGQSSFGFEAQINSQLDFVEHGWEIAARKESGERIPARSSMWVIYREDNAFSVNDVIPKPGKPVSGYDLVVASQPYRSRLDAKTKVDKILAPLARKLNPGGRMITIQATGRDPGMRIVRAIWPDEQPFKTPREILLNNLRETLNEKDYLFDEHDASHAEFNYKLQLNPEEVESSIGTSTLFAAWNAATYVAQIDDARLNDVIASAKYLEATNDVLQSHNGLWFKNECFVVTRI